MRRPSDLGGFTRPRSTGTLPRVRLFRALDRARRAPAVWVGGPPGAGKTTMLSTYAARRRLRTIWYQVRDGDADPATFFHYFGVAAEAAAPGKRKDALPHFTSEYLPNLSVFARRYFELVYQRLPARCALVFDNYHAVPQDAALHEVLREAVESVPDGINVIILSRGESPPALAPLRARGAIALLGAEELKLTAKECGDLARLRKVQIDKAALLQLYERMQGWTAGLVLALEHRKPSGSAAVLPAEVAPRVVFDYFAGEIFGHMERETQALLLQAAFLPSMAAERVAQLTGAHGAGRLLAELSRRNYFTIELGKTHPARPVYQFHPLFREFLLERAQETLEPGALARLREKAAALLETDGETADAIALLIAAQAWKEAMRIVLLHAEEMLLQGRGRILEAWLCALPRSLREQTPWTLYWLGMCRLAFDPVEARAHIEHAFHLFERDNDTAGVFSAWASIIETYMYEWGEFAPLDRWIGVLDALLARHPRLPGAAIEARVASGMFTALMYRQPQRPDLPQWADRLRSIVLKTSDVPTQMILGNKLLHYYTAWIGDLASAKVLIEAVRRPASAAAVGPLAYIAWCAMGACYHWYAGMNEECVRMVNDGMETVRQTGAVFMNTLLKTYGVYANLTTGDFAMAERLMRDAAGMSGARFLFRGHHHYLVCLNAFYRRDTLHAQANARAAVASADAAGVPFSSAMYRLSLAHALFSGGQRREALVHLAQARRIARSVRIAATEFTCLSTTIYFLLERGKRGLAVPLLRKMLGIAKQRRYVNRPFWTSEIMTCLFAAALEHGIEVEYVQESIRKRKLAPAPDVLHVEHWPLPVRIYTLGRFSVLIEGKPLEFSGKAQRKPLELLLALIAFGGRDVSERQLTEALWPDAEGDAAHQACAVALHRLRKLLACDEAISLQRNHFSLSPRHVWVDVWAFERWLAQEQGRSDAAQRRASERAMALYQGSFLSKRVDLPWAIAVRERLRTKFLRHLFERGRSLVESGGLAPAVAVFEKGVNVDALAEEFYRNLMLCYVGLGRRAEAIAVYQRCEQTLASTLGVAPAPDTVALYQTLRN